MCVMRVCVCARVCSLVCESERERELEKERELFVCLILSVCTYDRVRANVYFYGSVKWHV